MRVKDLLPLSLLYAAEDQQIQGRTKMQKLVFLAQQEIDADSGTEVEFEFEPYKYGPFSKELIETLETFDEKGVINRRTEYTFDGTKKYIYTLTPEGKNSFEYNLKHSPDSQTIQEILEESEDVVETYGRWSISKLLDHVYDEHPEMAKNSVY